jgi:hypothetical protein
MKDFQTILAEKRAYYGETEAAIEFAAEEFARQLQSPMEPINLKYAKPGFYFAKFKNSGFESPKEVLIHVFGNPPFLQIRAWHMYLGTQMTIINKFEILELTPITYNLLRK